MRTVRFIVKTGFFFIVRYLTVGRLRRSNLKTNEFDDNVWDAVIKKTNHCITKGHVLNRSTSLSSLVRHS